ncbi:MULTISPECIES: hypothetical protein, partial [unclassified Microcoleus]|uniref:hypothetical protein n=1 Tax=unclassified Microcoleus TaxID=2642155 RepID=UPI002FD03F51
LGVGIQSTLSKIFHYIIKLFCKRSIEILCYLELKEIEVAPNCIQKGKNIWHPLVVKYIEKMLLHVDSAEWNKLIETQPKVFLPGRDGRSNKIPIKWEQL